MRNFVLILLSIFLGTQTSFSQVSEADKQLANDLIEQAELIMEATQAMDIVRDMYVQAASADPNNIVANFRAGDFHIKTLGKDRAVPYFIKVNELDPDYRFDIKYWIGQSYQYGLEFDKALKYYQEYKDKVEKRPDYYGKDKQSLKDVERRIYECENGKEFVANPRNFSIKNLGSQINSEYDDYAPVLNKDQTLLVFTTRRREGNTFENVDIDNKPYEDVFVSQFQGNTWGPAENIGQPVNTRFHDSNLALSPDGTKLFLYTDDNNGDILVCDKNEDGSWSDPYSISDNVNSTGYKESSVSINADGTIIYFSSDRPGGFGGTDLYYCTQDKKGRWKKPQNMGPNINTEYNDDGPFIDHTGEVLYFSSRGRKGMGGYDVFKSRYNSEKQEWEEAVNMGYPISTPDDDIYFVMTNDGNTGYYASVKDGGFGFTDIYKISVPEDKEEPEPEPVIQDTTAKDSAIAQIDTTTKIEDVPLPPVKTLFVKLQVRDNNGQPMDAKVKLINTENETVSGVKKEGTGLYVFKIEGANNTNYRLSVEEDGYAFENQNLSLTASREEELTITKDVSLQKLQLGTVSILRNIYFDFNQATIKEASFDELSKLENMLVRNPGMKIEIAGHTDNIGDAAFNKDLSQRRVDAVKSYLVKKGIDPRKLKAVGYGEEKPLASNDDEKEGRELNRRVEFEVLQ